MNRNKIFITTIVCLISILGGISHAVIFKDHGGKSSIFYLNISEQSDSGNSYVTLKKGKSYEGVVGFGINESVQNYSFRAQLQIQNVFMNLPIASTHPEQSLPWINGTFVDLHFHFTIQQSMPAINASMFIEVMDSKGNTIIKGSFPVKIE